MRIHRTWVIYAAGAAALAASCCLALWLGAVNVPADEILSSPIIRIRLARIVLAMVAGAGLSVSGVIFQALLRNPLADPYVLGVSSGAGLGAAMVIVLGLSVAGVWTLPLAAFAGAAGTIFLVYALSRGPGGAVPVYFLLLSGVIVGSFFSSILMFLVTICKSEQLQTQMWWMLGNLEVSNLRLLGVVAAVVASGLAVACLLARDLNVMTLGEQGAAHLGLNVEQTKKAFFLVASLMTGATVSACGLIGFVGLIVPHSVRLVVGPDHRRLLPASALAGAAFLVLADTFARTVRAPLEIPIGVVTAFLGGPFFLVLLRRRRHTV